MKLQLVGSAAYVDLHELVGEELVNATAGSDGRWGLANAGWWGFAPARGRLELAAAEHVRSVVVRASRAVWGVSAGFWGKGC